MPGILRNTHFALMLILLPLGIFGVQDKIQKINLSPENWPKGELEQAVALNNSWGNSKPEATGHNGMVGGTTGALAVRAGVEALNQGGTAMDAACVTALTQITLAAGATVSFAGIMSVVYFEAESGLVTALNAPYAVPFNETDPYSIPKSGTASGRSALVPGFMKGIEAAHMRFGKLPFSKLFEPAIYFAENGIMVEGPLSYWIEQKKNVLQRLESTRKIFTGRNGRLLARGDLFIQQNLALTLRAVADEGAAYIYRGKWAQDFVQAVSAEGGKITLEDLKNYHVLWKEPLHTRYHDYDIYTSPAPFTGGQKIIESLNLLELADPAQYGHYSKSAEALYWLIQCSRMSHILDRTSKPQLQRVIPGASLDPEKRLSKENARVIWNNIKKRPQQQKKENQPEVISFKIPGGHSDGIVAIDKSGNVAAMCHTINTDTWGTTGIFVDGISIPDSACFLQSKMKAAGPGGYIANEMNPLIVLKDGKPVLASSSVGSGLHEATIGCLHNILDFFMSPKEALNMPTLLAPYWGLDKNGNSQFYKQVIPTGRYSKSLVRKVEEMGQPLEEMNQIQSQNYRGYWLGIWIDLETGERSGGVTPFFNGAVLSDHPITRDNNGRFLADHRLNNKTK